jgi:hypothetical protein
MKNLSVILLILFSTEAIANMAEPIDRGTLGSTPFISQYVDVVHEDLIITIDKDFKYANYNVTYHINSLKDSLQIPFLFYASEYLDNFKVTIDGKEITTSKIPYQYQNPESTKLNDFSYFFDEKSNDKNVYLPENESRGFRVTLEDMIYFETDISKGNHIINVTYRATSWNDFSDWVNNYSFRYALSPANYWKSFGTLSVTINAQDYTKNINTNIGACKSGDINTIGKWEFNKLPTDILLINYTPKINKTAATLINIGSQGIALILTLLLALAQLFLLIKKRKKYPQQKYFGFMIACNILIPFFFVVTWFSFDYVIDTIIGNDAVGKHGYSFLILFLYPLVLPFYWLFFWITDKIIKTKLNK